MKGLCILIPDSNAPAALNIAFCLKKEFPSSRILGASTEKRCSALYSRFIDKIFFIQKGREVEELLELIAGQQVDLLIPCSIFSISLVSEHLEVFSAHCKVVSLPSGIQLQNTENKLRFHRLMESGNISTPKTIALTENWREELHANKLTYPLICKPIQGSGGMGIVKLTSEADLLETISDDPARIGTSILQAYISGYDIDCSVLCEQGELKAYTIQRNFSYGTSNFKPPRAIHFEFNSVVLELSRSVVQNLGFHGIAHIDLRYDAVEKQFCVIELNPRYWASLLGSYSAGVNFPGLAIRSALGLKSDTPDYAEKQFLRFSTWLLRLPHGINSLSQTNLKYLMQDPLPRLTNKFYRR